MKFFLGLAVSASIAGLSAPSAAAPYEAFNSRIAFTHAASGYDVKGHRTSAGVLYLKGENPDTGKTFALRVSRNGQITGTWEGAEVDYRMDETMELQQLAQRDAN